jgi:eukaryotic-like serine/threonine-protein kinase
MGTFEPRIATYRFGPFELDPVEGHLSRDGSRVKLQDLPFRLLLMLVERPGGIVTREEVRQRLWPENAFGDFDNSLGVAVRKVRDSLGDDAESPRFVETIPKRGYRFLLPVKRGPQVTEQSEIPDALQSARGAAPGARSSTSRWVTVPAMLLGSMLLLLAGALTLRTVRSHYPSTTEARTSPSRPQIRRSVAVLGFRNLPARKDEDWMAKAFTEMLSTELAAGGALRLVSDEDVARAKRELVLGDQETLAKATLDRLRMNPGADVVVLGSYTSMPGKNGDRIRLDVRLQDTANGETIAEEAVTGSKEDIFEIATRAGAQLRNSLGMRALALDTAQGVRASLPSNESAIRFYSEGKAKLWDFDFVGARDLLVKAVAADPNSSLAHSALSDTWWHLGYRKKAKAEAMRALELSAALPREERLLIEGSYRGTMEDWPRAAEVYRTLFQLHPDSLEYGLHLAGAQYHVKPADALPTLKTLRQLPAPASDDPRIDLLEASSLNTQDLPAAQAAAKRAIAKGMSQGSHLMVARGYGILCQQGIATGVSTDENVSNCEKAIQSYASAGDRNNEARTRSDFAGVYYQRGDLAKAETMWRDAAKEFRQVGDPGAFAAATNNIADALLLEGKLSEAKKMLAVAVGDYREVEDNDGVALALNDLGDLSRQQGNLTSAETTFQQAKAIAAEIDDKNAVATILSGLGDLFKDRGELTAARKSYEDSLSIQHQTGEKQALGQTQLALALISIEEGRPEDAEGVVRQCQEQFRKEHEADDELSATAVLIQALLAQGKKAEAKMEMDRAQPLATKSQNRFASLQFALASASFFLSSDHPESSRTRLQQILKEAREHGYLGVEFEARFALAELDKKSGHGADAQAQLTSLERDANAKGFGLIARKAATLK